MSDFIDYHQLPYAWGKPENTALFKQQSDDFIVVEDLGFELDGEGKHVFLYIEKHNLNTMAVVEFLSQRLGVKQRDIGFSGLKDKFAVTRQWFSLPDKNLHLEQLSWPDNIRLLETSAHGKKLRRGVHKRNHFEIKLRAITGNVAELEARLEQVKRQGVPNYFAEQRFGFGMRNLEQAALWFAGEKVNRKTPKGMLISAARSYLFNLVLAQRIEQGNWQSALSGDCYNLAGTRSFFKPKPEEFAQLDARLEAFDIHPTGPLWGRGDSLVTDAANLLECQIIDRYPLLNEGLIAQGLKQERRALRLLPSQMQWQLVEADVLLLQLSLPAGSFATAVLRELINYAEE